MHTAYFPKLAATNLCKNYRTTLPFILTCTLTIIMYYTIDSLARNTSMVDMGGGESMMQMLSVGTWVIAIFAVVFLFYTNSFLTKRRKREFGLFTILGMEKKHVATILIIETLMTAGISLLCGLAVSMLINKLLFMALLRLIAFDITLSFQLSWVAAGHTILLFVGIFAITLTYNLITLHLSSPIALLRADTAGEREPKSKIILAIVGALSLGAGYAISIQVERPLDALYWFFLAVILVIIGTYLLFIAGSITILKALRKNKRYYYKSNHFISVSGMIYRMKQNAAGLATICILSTMVLVIVSTTVSLYLGIDSILPYMFPEDMAITQAEGQPYANREALTDQVLSIVQSQGLTATDVHTRDDICFGTVHQGQDFRPHDGNTDYVTTNDVCMTYLITAADCTQLTGNPVTLAPNQIMIYGNRDVPSGDITILDQPYIVAAHLDTAPLAEMGYDETFGLESVCLVVSDSTVLNTIYSHQAELYGDQFSPLRYRLSFNLNGTDAQKIDCSNAIIASLQEINAATVTPGISPEYRVDCRQAQVSSFYHIYGGLFFLGIFLGLVFLMATVVIIYYKQISEGYDDRDRFVIMQNVGLSQAEVRKAIHSQVLTVFFLPLIMACIHIAFAFPVITKLLKLFSLSDVGLFTLCTIGTIVAFVIFYTIVYALTSRAYYHIVRA